MTTTTECIFCNMAQDPMHAAPVYRDDRVFAIKDINPKAPVHMLIIPNMHIASLAYVGPGQVPIMGHMFVVAEEIARRDTRLAAHALNSETGLTPQQIWLFSYDAEKAAMGTDDEWRALQEW